MTSTGIVGSTGLVGSHILSTLLSLPTISSIHSLSRRAPASQDPKLHLLVSSDNASWPKDIAAISPSPAIFFSGLGTTRPQAGSFEAQRLIDYDLNIAVATAAKERGVKTFVLISSSGANLQSMLTYFKMKADIEEAIKKLDFEHTVIVRPALIVGEREDSRPWEFGLRKLAGWAGYAGLKDFWAQDADVIARASVAAGMKTINEGEKVDKVWIVGRSEIVKLGRTEWKE